MKNVKSRLDKGLEPVVEMLEKAGLSVNLDLDGGLEQARQGTKAILQQAVDAGNAIAGVTKETVEVAYPDKSHTIKLNIYKPSDMNETLPVLYHTHGGGLVMGEPEQQEDFLKTLVKELSCILVSVDYRLAPEFPFPTPLEDIYLGLKWTLENAQRLKIDTTRVVILGESAGGGLTAALAQLSRDRNEFPSPIAYQLLLYPMLDCRNTEPLVEDEEDTFVWTKANNIFGWSSYLQDDPLTCDIPAYASPIHTGNLENLPPAMILIGGIDQFIEENIEYAKPLNKAGVATELHVYPGGFHGFEMLAPDLVISKQLHQDMQNGLKKSLDLALERKN